MTADNERQTYNVREAAEVLGVSKNSLYQAVLRKEVPSIRIGKRILIPKAQLERLLLNEVNNVQR